MVSRKSGSNGYKTMNPKSIFGVSATEPICNRNTQNIMAEMFSFLLVSIFFSSRYVFINFCALCLLFIGVRFEYFVL